MSKKREMFGSGPSELTQNRWVLHVWSTWTPPYPLALPIPARNGIKIAQNKKRSTNHLQILCKIHAKVLGKYGLISICICIRICILRISLILTTNIFGAILLNWTRISVGDDDEDEDEDENGVGCGLGPKQRLWLRLKCFYAVRLMCFGHKPTDNWAKQLTTHGFQQCAKFGAECHPNDNDNKSNTLRGQCGNIPTILHPHHLLLSGIILKLLLPAFICFRGCLIAFQHSAALPYLYCNWKSKKRVCAVDHDKFI